ncbi:MAG TPA: ABC transporter ATP-binding protein [candidate division Zixibacteria bacterium]|nr:ABC transporter ATP-binding protein [candidate division Zixibacteria bacterium]
MSHSNTSFPIKWIQTYLYPYIASYKWSLFMGAIISCAMAGLNYFNLQFIRQLFDEKLYMDSFSQFFYMLTVIFGIIFAYNLMNWFQANLTRNMIVNINEDLIEHFYIKTCNMPFLFFHSHSPGQLLTLLLRDTTEVTPLIPLVFIDLVKNVLILIIIFLYLIKIQWAVLLLYVCLGLGYLVISRYFTERIKKLIPDIQKTREAIHNKLIEYFQVINLLKIYDVKDIEKNKVKTLNSLLATQNRKIIYFENKKNFLLESMTVFVICAFVLFGFNLISHNVITAGKFITILIASYLVNGYVRALFDIYSKVHQISAYVGRLDRTFSDTGAGMEKERNQAPGERIRITAPVHSIVFDNVHFTYNRYMILKNVSCTFEADAITGITGESGYGKTTILNLILKLIYPSSGNITINGLSAKDVDSPSYLQQISYLPQTSLLFNGTIADNIAFGEDELDRDKIIQSAKMANIHNFILNTAQGYDTPITTGTSSISEGERKRVEIARALYKDSSIIILDEPTANLDLKNKIAIIEVLKAIRNKVVIIVSHDLSVLENCDKILLINSQKQIEVLSSYESVYQYYAHNT